MAVKSSRGQRLLRRYPILAPASENERSSIVGASLRNPLVLLLVLGGGLLLLPPYFHFAFAFLRVEQEPDTIFKMAKLGAAVLLPLCIAVPLLSRFVLPFFIRREMEKRGYSAR
ncbi:MAG: hypothetical protein FWG04_03660 [Desulfovibrionaceae bacterium]|nr:hypothetical protein [Desulfovibrionaceae bacterium]